MKTLISVIAMSLFAGLSNAEPPCVKPVLNASNAFELISKRDAKMSLKTYLENNLVSRFAVNEKCENMYVAAMYAKNEATIQDLETIRHAPKNEKEKEINGFVHKNFNLNYYDYSLLYGDTNLIKKLKSKGGQVTTTSGQTALMFASWSNTKDVVEMLINEGSDVNLQVIMELRF